MENYKRYDGTSLQESVSVSVKNLDGSETVEEIFAYFPSKELVDVVEYARILKRPLLVRGEPGCGKTRLAQAVAYELYGDKYHEKYFEWNIKSTSKVNDGLYYFDHLRRLRDVQTYGKDELKKKEEVNEYRSYMAIGNAFRNSKKNAPSILLIDEIDKADIDFPNDLLLELDQKRFSIPETCEEIKAEESPIIFITSNDEKELPNAFLRRCIFYYIDFPDSKQLLRIVKSQAKHNESIYKKALPDGLLKTIVERFETLYNDMQKNPNTAKKVSTSELLDWLKVIHYYYVIDKLPLTDGTLPTTIQYSEILLKSLDGIKLFKGTK